MNLAPVHACQIETTRKTNTGTTNQMQNVTSCAQQPLLYVLMLLSHLKGLHELQSSDRMLGFVLNK